MHNMTSVEVESLPANLPEYIPVDVSILETLDDSIHVSDLAAPKGVTILTPSDELVAKVVPLRVEKEEVKVEEAVEAVAPEEAAVEAAKEEEKEVA
ncbi:MAG: hypothetical protein M1358_01760 [Chloroflexi bacterium]|nr:hypothetical protein [Chloroflexota bacterium]